MIPLHLFAGTCAVIASLAFAGWGMFLSPHIQQSRTSHGIVRLTLGGMCFVMGVAGIQILNETQRTNPLSGPFMGMIMIFAVTGLTDLVVRSRRVRRMIKCLPKAPAYQPEEQR